MRNLTESAKLLAISAHPRAVLFRFLLVGGSLTLLFVLLSSALALRVGLRPAIASGFSYLACVPLGYWAQRTLAFRSDAPHAHAFVRYALLQLPLLGLSALFSWVLITKLHGPTIISFLVIGPSVAIVSFFAQRAWTFSHR